MKKIVIALLLISLFSCQKKEVFLPQIPETVVSDVKDHSPIYMFFEIKDKDTLVEVNRKNSIISTNWLFNIDKRLPLRLVIPEIQKLQAKKENSEHKNAAADNYFTYMDSKKRTLAFLSFTDVIYKVKKTKTYNIVYFKKNGKVNFNNQELVQSELENYLNNLIIENESEISIGYDKNLSFQNYISNRFYAKKLAIKKLGLSINYKEEYIY